MDTPRTSVLSNLLPRPRRLISTRTYELVNFTSNRFIPEYAIVSHRWKQGEEIGLTEYVAIISGSRGDKKTGYIKIMMACKRARHDGISWIWIDTCCIDKGSHEDVAWNIKSMYAFYQNAQICYAFLRDVSTAQVFEELDSGDLKMEVEESEWFQRGWTLQELLAPKDVIFFDKDWKEIGRRSALTDEPYTDVISLRTGIPEPVLEGRVPLQDVDMVKRLCWSVDRQTTKPEDQAYCLLGILGVSMEPCYGEGTQKAFERLQQVLIK
ncbi:HET-domain-containing protein, partial [Dendrothele bispora CBS 962.96]